MDAMKKLTSSPARIRFDALLRMEIAEQETVGPIDDSEIIEALEKAADYDLPLPVVQALAYAVGALVVRFEEVEAESLRELARILDAAAHTKGTER